MAELSTGRERAVAKEMQKVALAFPLSEANPATHRRYFRSIGREVAWGLTLNK